MKLATVRKQALALPEVTEQPHFDFSSFRVRGKIFLTVPPGDQFLHVFVDEKVREPALAMYPEFLEKLTWGKKVIGLRVTLEQASPDVVKRLVLQAWETKAPASLAKARA